MTASSEADGALNQFALDLAAAASAHEWVLVRFHESHTDRKFELRGQGRVAAFTAKMSLSENGFWGLTEEKAEDLVRIEREHLLLLRGSASGFFLSSVAFERLTKKFSRTRENAVRINLGVIKGERRFADAEEAFDLLQARSM